MATVSFNRAAKAPAAAATAPAPAEPANVPAVAEPVNMAVATPVTSTQLEGEFTARDMAVPRLKLGQKTGQVTDEHPEWVGQWIFDGAVAIGNKANVIVTKLHKYYLEDLPYGSDEKPRMFKTSAEAMQAGCPVKDVCDIDMLVECNADLDQFAVLDAEGKSYAPARYTVTSSAYGRTVGIILRDLAGWLKGDLASGVYAMSTQKKTDGQNSWFTPKLDTAGKTPEAVRAEIREKFGV